MESEDYVKLFSIDLNLLILEYQYKITNADVLGILKLMGDDISEKTRHETTGPHPLS